MERRALGTGLNYFLTFSGLQLSDLHGIELVLRFDLCEGSLSITDISPWGSVPVEQWPAVR